MQVHGFICSSPVYEFDGWTFEFNRFLGPWPLRKDWEPRKRAGDKFYAMFNRWFHLPYEEREAYRVGGGCQRF